MPDTLRYSTRSDSRLHSINLAAVCSIQSVIVGYTKLKIHFSTVNVSSVNNVRITINGSIVYSGNNSDSKEYSVTTGDTIEAYILVTTPSSEDTSFVFIDMDLCK